MIFLRLLRMLWPFCSHSHYHRDRDRKTGVLWFVCDCGRRVPAIIRTPAERRAMLRTFKPVPQAKARRVVEADKVINLKDRR